MSDTSIVTPATGEEKAEFYTVPAVARKLRVSEFTVRRLIWDGKLKGILVGCRVRVRDKDLEDYLRGRAWSPELCREETGRPTLRGPKPKAPAVTPAEPVAEVAPAHEVSE